ncbi:unnamed protein product [Brassica oleracea var. botrytis]|uniref:Uncharacterized protein n=1 Tax=Brassica oleracea TaxID=3712 RepID=A0A3P6DKK1_BRAOL|nr:unnamed protein product [Brassica oleracea]
MMGKGSFSIFKTRKERTRLKFLGLGGLNTTIKQRLNLKLSFLDSLRFRMLSIIEAMVVVSKLAFFFLCCGCKF